MAGIGLMFVLDEMSLPWCLIRFADATKLWSQIRRVSVGGEN